MKEYEEDYHSFVHNYLIYNPKYYNARARLALKRYFSDVPEDYKILEFGCGLGQNIYLLPNAVGYDISKFALGFSKNKGVNTIEDLKDVNNFDVVFSSHVLEHVENPCETINIMKSKLKKNGKLILILPVEKHEKVKFRLDKHQHLYCWNFKSINNLLIKSGFKIVENKYLHGGGYKKLLLVSRIYFKLYILLTRLTGFLYGTKEMKIVATKKS